MERSYSPKERIRFYEFITARGEWGELRQIAKDLGWDRNKLRQFDRIRAYWEGRSSQSRRGDRTAYMDELINEYIKRHGINPEIVMLEDFPEEIEYRATFDEFDEAITYGDGTIFYDDGDLKNSPFGYLQLNPDGTIDVGCGDSGGIEI